MPKVVIAKELLGKGYENRKAQCEGIIAELPEKHLTDLEIKTGIHELKTRLASVDCVVICNKLQTGEGIEELLGAYYPGGLPPDIWKQIPDTTGLTLGKPAIALFADALDRKSVSIALELNAGAPETSDALWAKVLLHEVGHAVLPIHISCYQNPYMKHRSEALANWFAWHTLKSGHQFIFEPLTDDQSEEYRSYRLLLEAQPIVDALLQSEAREDPARSRLDDDGNTEAAYAFINMLSHSLMKDCQTKTCLTQASPFTLPRIPHQEIHDGIHKLLTIWAPFFSKDGEECSIELREMPARLAAIRALLIIEDTIKGQGNKIAKTGFQSFKKKPL